MARHWIVGAGLLGWLASVPATSAATLSPEYLTGRWTSGAADHCSRAEHEQTVFRDDGTFATEYGGRALAVGFWLVEDDKIEMQILTTEASLPQSLQDALPGDYHALQVKGLAFDVTDDSFRMVQSIAGDLRGVDMVRCPAP